MSNTLNYKITNSIVKWKTNTNTSINGSWSRPFNNSDNFTNSGTEFKARPIKHWRKQLFPRDGALTNRNNVMSMDVPGGNSFTNLNGCNNNVAFTEENVIKNKNENCCTNTNITRRSSTNLNKNYYTDSRAYLKSRCKTFQQNLSGNTNNNSDNFDSDGNQLWPNDDNNGPQVKYIGNSNTNCSDEDNNRCTLIYKPNNRNFATQGAVSSGERLLRLKLNTVNKNGASFLTAYGSAGANAGKYHGTSEGPYFLKSKENKCTNYHRNGHKTVCFKNTI